MSTTTENPKTMKAVSVQPFGVEIDHPRNCDVMLQSIVGCRLRTKIKPSSETVDGQTRTPQLRQQSPPMLPGMQIHVDPKNRTYVIVDPLNEDERAQERLKKFLQVSAGTRIDGSIRGEETRRGSLDANRMKSLCRELLWIIEAGEAKVVKGPAPEMDDVDDLPGDYLLNPGARIENTQPMLEKDYERWKNELTMRGSV